MKIFELLSGQTQPLQSPAAAATAPMSNVQMPSMNPTATAQSGGAAPGQQAGLGSTISDFFMSGPKPIGGAKPAAPTPAAPAPTGQPAQTPGSAFGDRMFGNSAVGRTLDAVNGGLTGNLPKPQQ